MLPIVMLTLLAHLATVAQGMDIEINGEVITVNLQPANSDAAREMNGSDAFVRLAQVTKCPDGFPFPQLTVVASKFARSKGKPSIQKEAKAYRHIKEQISNFGGVPAVSDLGTVIVKNLTDTDRVNLQLPEDEEFPDEFLALMMQRLYQDLHTFIATHISDRGDSIKASELLIVLDQIDGYLGAFERMGIVHGDIKPGNILLVQNNSLAGGVRLADLGQSYILGSEDLSPGGDVTFRSPQLMEKGIGGKTLFELTSNDDDFSLDMTGIYVSGLFLPYMKRALMIQESLHNELSNEKKIKYWNDIIEMKRSFKFSDYPQYNPVDDSLKRKLMVRLFKALHKRVDDLEINAAVIESSSNYEEKLEDEASSSNTSQTKGTSTTSTKGEGKGGCVPIKGCIMQ